MHNNAWNGNLERDGNTTHTHTDLQLSHQLVSWVKSIHCGFKGSTLWVFTSFNLPTQGRPHRNDSSRPSSSHISLMFKYLFQVLIPAFNEQMQSLKLVKAVINGAEQRQVREGTVSAKCDKGRSTLQTMSLWGATQPYFNSVQKQQQHARSIQINQSTTKHGHSMSLCSGPCTRLPIDLTDSNKEPKTNQ